MPHRKPDIDLLFQALGDATRRALVKRISQGPLSVSQLAEPFDMSLAAIVQHVQVLEDSGLIRTEKLGRVRTCRMNPAALSAAEQWLNHLRSSWDRRLDRLGESLAEEEDLN